MNKLSWMHPEVRMAVINEYLRMKAKNPQADGNVMWRMAKEYVKALAIADTADFTLMYMTPGKDK